MKAKIDSTTPTEPVSPRKRATRSASSKEYPLLVVRMRELDREFARQTKQLKALTKKFGKKLNEPIIFGKNQKR